MLKRFAVVLLAAATLLGEDAVEKWPQFRGPSGSGIGEETSQFPTRFDAETSVLWKTELPTGHGSPCIWGDRIFVTAVDPDAGHLEVLAVDRDDGSIVWRRTVEAAELEEVHDVSSPATSTPTTDGESVYVYFGSVGLLAFDFDGEMLWRHDMGVAKSRFGSGSSPIIAEDLVLIHRDYPETPYLLALNKSDGSIAWKTNLELRTVGGGPKTAHSTLVLWKGQVVIYRPGQLSSHRLDDGGREWWVEVGGGGTSTPVVSDEQIYVAAPATFGNPDRLVEPAAFSQALADYDANDDGKLSREECPALGLFLLKRPGVADDVPGAHFTVKGFFGFVDGDKDGVVTEEEYDGVYGRLKNFRPSGKGVTAVRPEGRGDLSLTALEWTYSRAVPEVPTVLVYHDRVYAVANGGILTSLDAGTGNVLFRGRLQAPGAYYASPVAAGGRIVFASSEGVVSVLADGDTLEVLSSNDLGEPIFGTPALMQEAIYIRSLNHLWAFGSVGENR